MISFLKTHLSILIIILILFSYLGIKALNPDGWDGWGFGSAQTLMSSQYWAKDGFAKNYFLFIAIPYSKLAGYFDESEFRNRTIENPNGGLARDRRLYYTHYPPLYLLPYALIAKMGVENRAVFRIFSLLISLAGLLFFYLFIKSVSSKTIAVIASIYYGFSVTFLNYADSISVQPWNIIFIFLILYLNAQEKRRDFIIWPVYLALSLSSYDATFFVFAFFILFDILILKKFLWKRWLALASAPILGFALQMIQNTWYLGWQDMANDFYRYYAGRAIGSFKNFVLGLITPFVTMAGIKTLYFFKKTFVALGGASLLFMILWKLRSKSNIGADFFKIIILLVIAAVTQPFFLNVTGWWPYQGILTASFWGLIIGTSTAFVLKTFSIKKILDKKEKFLFGFLILITAMLWFYQFSNTWDYLKAWPNNRPNQKIIDFSKTIKLTEPGKEKIAFRIIPRDPYSIWNSQFPNFNFEYYLGMPKIDFANPRDLMVDFWWLRNVSEYPFYSFIIAENKNDIEKIRQELIKKNIRNISPVAEIQGQYLFTVDPK